MAATRSKLTRAGIYVTLAHGVAVKSAGGQREVVDLVITKRDEIGYTTAAGFELVGSGGDLERITVNPGPARGTAIVAARLGRREIRARASEPATTVTARLRAAGYRVSTAPLPPRTKPEPAARLAPEPAAPEPLAAAPPQMAPPPATPTPATPMPADEPGTDGPSLTLSPRWVTFGAIAAVALGSFLPWESSLGNSVSGIDGNGKITLLCAIVGVVAFNLTGRIEPRARLVTSGVAGAISVLVAILGLTNGVAIGIFLTLLGGIAWVAAMVWEARSPTA